MAKQPTTIYSFTLSEVSGLRSFSGTVKVWIHHQDHDTLPGFEAVSL